jgi:hypothetical protein
MEVNYILNDNIIKTYESSVQGSYFNTGYFHFAKESWPVEVKHQVVFS